MHYTFEIRDCVFIGRICVSNPAIKIADCPVCTACRTWRIVGDEVNPVIDISAIDPPITCAYAVFFIQISTKWPACFHNQRNYVTAGCIACNQPRPKSAYILIDNCLYSRTARRIVKPCNPRLICFSDWPIDSTDVSHKENDGVISRREEYVHTQLLARFHIKHSSILSSH